MAKRYTQVEYKGSKRNGGDLEACRKGNTKSLRLEKQSKREGYYGNNWMNMLFLSGVKFGPVLPHYLGFNLKFIILIVLPHNLVFNFKFLILIYVNLKCFSLTFIY